MSNPAFIVEGHMEQQFIKKACCGTPVVRFGTNGKDVSLDTIAHFIDNKIRLFNNRNYPIYIIMDRENRAESSDYIKAQLLQLLAAKGHTVEIVIAVPDKMIENWILADLDSIREKYGVDIPAKNYEGTNGKSILKSALGRGNYSETIDGVEMLSSSVASNIARNSPSFASFHDDFPDDCWWLER